MKAYFGICIDSGLSYSDEIWYVDKVHEIVESLDDHGFIIGDPVHMIGTSTRSSGKQVVYASFELTKTFWETRIFLEQHWIGLEEFKFVMNFCELEGFSLKKTCTCGACKTFGENCDKFYHFKWCDINK